MTDRIPIPVTYTSENLGGWVVDVIEATLRLEAPEHVVGLGQLSTPVAFYSTIAAIATDPMVTAEHLGGFVRAVTQAFTVAGAPELPRPLHPAAAQRAALNLVRNEMVGQRMAEILSPDGEDIPVPNDEAALSAYRQAVSEVEGLTEAIARLIAGNDPPLLTVEEGGIDEVQN